MVKKLYYSMGEVTEMFDVTPALIRYWCEQFDNLRPKRNAKGNRLFTPSDIEQLKLIYHLLKEKRMTIEGAKKALKKGNVVSGEANADIELLEQLQKLRAMLVEVRNGIGDMVEDDRGEYSAESGSEGVPSGEEAEAELSEVAEESKPKKRRAPRRKKGEDGVVERPLFPFYEQTLF